MRNTVSEINKAVIKGSLVGSVQLRKEESNHSDIKKRTNRVVRRDLDYPLPY